MSEPAADAGDVEPIRAILDLAAIEADQEKLDARRREALARLRG